MRELCINYKKGRRIITKKAYTDDDNLQVLKQKAKENWEIVHKLFNEFHIKYKKEHDRWNIQRKQKEK